MICKQCGKCCKGIRINFPLDAQLEQILTEISEAEAIQLHSIFRLFPDSGKYYNCKMLQENNTCGIHESKPSMCCDFPIAGRSMKDNTCGYFNIEDKFDFVLEISRLFSDFIAKNET
jgi:Fe-S-cluster containining protein